jgi:hypothetical protein
MPWVVVELRVIQLVSIFMPPGVELGTMGIDRGAVFVIVAVNRKALLLFPTLGGADSPLQVSGDLFP